MWVSVYFWQNRIKVLLRENAHPVLKYMEYLVWLVVFVFELISTSLSCFLTVISHSSLYLITYFYYEFIFLKFLSRILSLQICSNNFPKAWRLWKPFVMINEWSFLLSASIKYEYLIYTLLVMLLKSYTFNHTRSFYSLQRIVRTRTSETYREE
jgi:hypothetical protein